MKKLLTLLLVAAMALGCLSLAACGGNEETKVNRVELASYEITEEDFSDVVVPADFKVGFIFLHDSSSTYDLNFINAANEATQAFGFSSEQVKIRTGVDESIDCYNTARDLVEEGCDLIFADSFGHEQYMVNAAKDFPSVQFFHATGVKAHTEQLPNYHNAFASIYEGRYLAGVAAGMKLNEMIAAGKFSADQAKIGYIGAFTYAEVISGYTSFYLGARSVCPSATMDVTFTGSWYDVTAESNAAKNLIQRGCKLISQHADSMGAPSACEEAGIPNVSYNGSTIEACPNTFIISSRINWTPYMKYIIAKTIKGESVDYDFVGTLKNGSVALTELNGDVMAKGTKEKIEEVRAQLIAGTLHVFDTSKFTVDGVHLDSYLADVDDYGDYVGETEAISDGYFHESEYRSAPYFDLTIDGITLLDTHF